MVDSYSLSGIVQVKLISFTASLTLDQKVALQWVTTLEENIKNFVIERSTDNINFKDIDTVAAVNNGEYTQDYNELDNSPANGTNYYRLRITNNDGDVTYSAIVSVTIVRGNAPLMFPNPASTFVNIRQGTELVKLINFYDILGRNIKSVRNEVAENTINIPTYNLARGTYLVEIRTEKTVYQQKLLIR
jgi:hypothetical protein